MNKIFYIVGKSSSGKDTIYNHLIKDLPELKPLVTHTTRPMRPGEIDGITYHFVTENGYQELKDKGEILEERVYHTVKGDWIYFTSKSSIENSNNYLGIGSLESYNSLKAYYRDSLIPIYIEVDDKNRLIRSIERESRQDKPDYKEICRRFLADTEDFSEEKLKASGIEKRYDNNSFLSNICKEIKTMILNILDE